MNIAVTFHPDDCYSFTQKESIIASLSANKKLSGLKIERNDMLIIITKSASNRVKFEIHSESRRMARRVTSIIKSSIRLEV